MMKQSSDLREEIELLRTDQAKRLSRQRQYMNRIGELQLEIKRLRDLLAFNYIDPDAHIDAAKGHGHK